MARSGGSRAPTWRRRSGALLRRRGVGFECGCASRALARLAIDFKSRVGRTGCGRRPRARRVKRGPKSALSGVRSASRTGREQFKRKGGATLWFERGKETSAPANGSAPGRRAAGSRAANTMRSNSSAGKVVRRSFVVFVFLCLLSSVLFAGCDLRLFSGGANCVPFPPPVRHGLLLLLWCCCFGSARVVPRALGARRALLRGQRFELWAAARRRCHLNAACLCARASTHGFLSPTHTHSNHSNPTQP